MKKSIVTIILCFATMWAMAGNGEGNCGVYLLVNGESQNYRLSETDWGNNGITASLNGKPVLAGAEIGQIKSLVLCGGMMVAWADGNDYFQTNSFRVQYRVYKQDSEAGEWAVMPLDEETYRSGNDYRYEATDKTIDLRALTDGSGGTWVFEAQMLGHKYWDNGSSTGSWDENHDPYSATFTLPTTYYITGSGSSDANGNWCGGKSWNSAADVTMAGSSHTFNNVAAGTHHFKVTNGAWNTNNEYGYDETDLESCDPNVWSNESNNITITTDATSDITINFDARLAKVSVTSTLGRFVRLPYSVVGDPKLGLPQKDGNWDVTSTATEMTRQDDGTYRYVIQNIELEAHNGRKFKIVGSHSWGIYQAPASGDFTVDIPQNGHYNLIFDFDPSTNQATCTPVLRNDVTISAYGYSTFYSDKAWMLPDGLTATIFTQVNGTALVGESIDLIPANTGVLLSGTANATYTLLQTTTDVTYSNNLFRGTTSDETIADNGKVHYILGTKSGECGLYWPSGTEQGVGAFENKAGKAYLEIEPSAAPAGAPGFILRGKDVVTAVEDLPVNEDGEYYDLLGRKVTHPQPGNLYICNGKKILLF